MVVGLAAGVAACAAGGGTDTTDDNGGAGAGGGTGGSGGKAGGDGGKTDGGGGSAGSGGSGGAAGSDASTDGGGGAAGDASVDGSGGTGGSGGSGGTAGTGGTGGTGGTAGTGGSGGTGGTAGSGGTDGGCTGCKCNVEICNGLDDNCNGQIDEGDPGGGATCDTGKFGVCKAGVQHCVNGSIKCVQTVAATTEVCDGIDNNCDNQIDESDPNIGAACTTGEAGICNAGSKFCNAANSPPSLDCKPNFLPGQQNEICNGLDDNCNGSTDEGNPGGGANCDTGKLGVCAAGVTSCSNGQLLCNQQTTASSEVCDGKDNDCNGTIDDPAAVNGQTCNSGKPGICSTGITSCSGGALTCTATVTPGSKQETCNGQDDDCNGTADDGSPTAMCTTQYPTAVHVQNWTCANAGTSNAACGISQCAGGFSDIDNSVANGCECAGSLYATTCGTATSVDVPWGSYGATAITKTGIINTASGDAWFAVSFSGAPFGAATSTTVHFQAKLSSDGGGEYAMTAYQACGSLAQCPLPNQNSGDGPNGDPNAKLSTWEFTASFDGNCPLASACTNSSAVPSTMYIRVRRTNGAATCDAYGLTFSNSSN